MRWPRLSAEVLPLLITISPLIGVATTAFMSRWNVWLVRPMALSNATMTLLLVILGMFTLPTTDHGEQEGQRLQQTALGINWLTTPVQSVEMPKPSAPRGLTLRVSWAMDGLSVWPALLLSLTVWASLCCSTQQESFAFASRCTWLMISQTMLFASLFATDAIATILFLELALVPIYWMIGTEGDVDRRSVAGQWWIWQTIGCSSSLLGATLLAVSQPWMQSDLVVNRGPALFNTALLADSLRQLLNRSETALQIWNHLAPWSASLFLLGLMIRLPVFPFMGWYQSTLVSAPAGISAVIASVFPLVALSEWMLLGLPLFGLDNHLVLVILATTALFGILQSTIAMPSETDLKQLLAYLSSAMLCAACIGLSFRNRDGVRGAWLLVVCQGLAVPCGLLLVPILESRYGTRDLSRLAGLLRTSTRLATILGLLFLGWAAVPIAHGFSALLLQLSATSAVSLWMILGESVALVVLAAAAVRIFTQIMSRSVDRTYAQDARADMSGMELLAVAPFLALLLILNTSPTTLLDMGEPVFRRMFPRTEQRTTSTPPVLPTRQSLPCSQNPVAGNAPEQTSSSDFSSIV